jgi:hypothetical protein
MQFPANPTTELIIPAGAQFAPGNDVIGIGFAVPDELAALDINSAIITYNSLYDPNSSLPRVVYTFIGQQITADPDYSVAQVMGSAWQKNPAAGSPLILVASWFCGMAAPSASGYTTLEAALGAENQNGNSVLEMASDTNGNPTFVVVNDAGTHRASKAVTTTTPSTTWTAS